MDPRIDALLRGQQEYYDARAAEYDEWWTRQGRYARGAEVDAQWFREQAVLYAALDQLDLSGHVLELACGTGNWTLPLSHRAARLTAVDGSLEMLRLNRARVLSDRVTYVQADLFAWEPAEAYDAAVFCFWLSHVPEERLDPFLAKVRRAVRPGGAVFFADSSPDPLGTSTDQPLSDGDGTVMTRRLNDGRQFRIVKRYDEPRTLTERFAACGLELEIRRTGRFFIFGAGRSTTS
jgi:SAM-dependent methyltransferase